MPTFTGTNGDDSLTGTSGDDSMLGLAGNDFLNGAGGSDTLTGGDGNDILDGGAGADTMIGGTGDEVYGVDHVSDVVTELPGEGTDRVNTNLASYTLGANLENMLYTGAGSFAGTGNALDNYIIGGAFADTLTGGAGNDTLDGGTGADTLVGGTGDDIYGVENASDVVTELSGEGTDRVNTNLASYTLGANLENIQYTGAGSFVGTGNALDNYIIGGAFADTLTGGVGNDTLDGGTGADTMVGGQGDDVFGVENASDVVTELANEGIDSVQTTLSSYTLGANIEHLTYTGNSAFAGTGNSVANVIVGGSGNDTLDGQGGSDMLEGGSGNDSLTGGAGSDLLLGGNGTDTAIFAGDQIGYEITYNAETGNFIVTDVNAANGDDGVDTLTQVEKLQFNGQTVTLTGPVEAWESVILVPKNGTAAGTLTGKGSNLTYQVEDEPEHGSLTINTDGTFTYVPTSGYGGGDTFTYRVTDPAGVTAAADVTISVGEQGNGAETSVQFENSDGSQLTATFSNGDQQKWTWSGWVKLDEPGSYRTLFSDRAQSNTTGLVFNSNDQLEAHIANGSSTQIIRTNASFTDQSSWIHIVWSVDTTQATASDRNVLYINGERVTSLELANYPPQNYTSALNSAKEHSIGVNSTSNPVYFDGLMADINFVDGQQLDASAFGMGTGGSWTSKEYIGAYGTNGFHLGFEDSGAVGNDTSGNDNDWAPHELEAVNDGPGADAVEIEPTRGNDVFIGTGVQNVFAGLGGNDVLDGAGGNDVFTGGEGNDALIGGSGFDAAIYSGTRSGYDVLYDVELGKLIVKDLNVGNGDDGADTLTGVEELRFVDETVTVGTPPEAHKSAILVPVDGEAAGTLTGQGANLVYSLEDGPDHGTVNISGNGTFSYEPNATYTGADSFVYRVTDTDSGISSLAEVTIGVGGPRVDHSAYFDNASTARLTQTFSTGNSQEWTWSGWVKVADLGSLRTLFSDRATTYTTGLVLNSNNQLEAHIGNGSSASYVLTSNATFTNTSDWIHIVWSVDTTQATAANRSHLYVDGVELASFASANYPPQNFVSGLNSAKEHSIGVNSTSSLQYFDGYLADVNFVDGQQLSVSSFGFSNNGDWQPKDYSGAFGTNGFHLTFDESGALGEDSSGNGNDWTVTSVQAVNQGPTTGVAEVEVEPTDGNDVFVGSSNDDALATGAGNDVLSGGSGDDTLAGGAGDDILIGGTGDDVYVFDRGGNIDTVTNSAMDSAIADDRVEFGSNIAFDQLWLVQSGDDLVVSIIGTGDSIRIEDWYASETARVDTLRTTADGYELTEARVAALVTAMSSYSPPTGGDPNMPPEVREDLDAALTAAWQLF
jgi:Ca2+-binding RTX toxin-like protein